VNAFSLPTRNRGYVVGDHGMIYRYRIVPANYTAKGMIDAPLMPPYGGRVAEEVQKMKAVVATLRSKLGASQAGPQNCPITSVRRAVAASDVVEQYFCRRILQDNSGPQTSGGFVQDTSDVPLSPAMQSCCAAGIQNFQTDFSSFAQQVPRSVGSSAT